MKKFTSIFFVPFIILLVAIYFIKTSNRLNKFKIIIDESKKNVDISLGKRYDTICQMLRVAKSYAKYEKDTFENLANSRETHRVNDFNKTIKNQDKALYEIFALAEAYPDLRSSEEFVNLQKEIDEENEQLAAAKRIVNNNISIYNQEIVTFPTSIVANIKSMKKIDFLREDKLENKIDIDDFDYEI